MDYYGVEIVSFCLLLLVKEEFFFFSFNLDLYGLKCVFFFYGLVMVGVVGIVYWGNICLGIFE